jgi:hypothetical protein
MKTIASNLHHLPRRLKPRPTLHTGRRLAAFSTASSTCRRAFKIICSSFRLRAAGDVWKRALTHQFRLVGSHVLLLLAASMKYQFVRGR